MQIVKIYFTLVTKWKYKYLLFKIIKNIKYFIYTI